jgi:ABC-type transport system involved in multi-copper enzyme maturation permease subunit
VSATVISPHRSSDRYGLRQIISSEAIKITTLRSSVWALLITAAGMLGVTAIATNSVLHKSAQWYQGFDPTNQSLTGTFIGVLTMGVFGALVVTGEYASGTIRTSLSATPHRLLFLAGKALVAAAGMLAVAETLTFGCFYLGQSILSGGGAPHASFGQPGVARAVIMSGAFLALFGLLGMGLGVIVRSTAGAISTYVGVTFLLPLVLHQLSGQPSKYAPVQILSNSVSSTVTNFGQVSPVVGLLLMILYVAAAFAAGAALFRLRDA